MDSHYDDDECECVCVCVCVFETREQESDPGSSARADMVYMLLYPPHLDAVEAQDPSAAPLLNAIKVALEKVCLSLERVMIVVVKFFSSTIVANKCGAEYYCTPSCRTHTRAS